VEFGGHCGFQSIWFGLYFWLLELDYPKRIKVTLVKSST